MNEASSQKQGLLSVLSPSRAKRSFKHLFYASPLYRMMPKGRPPDALRLAPPSYRLGDPETGRAILGGVFALSHYRAQLGDAP